MTLGLLLISLAIAPPLAPAPRTPAASANPAAQVVVLEGVVTAKAGGVTVPVQPGTLLDASDQLLVPPGAWVSLLLLANEHVVRLDDDVTLRVNELALFDAPKASRSMSEQLESLLTRAERRRLHERVTGFHASLSPARAMPSTASNQKPARESLGIADMGKGGGGIGSAKSSATMGGARGGPQAEKKQLKSTDLALDDESAATPPPASPSPPPPPREPTGASPKRAMPAGPRQPLVADDRLKLCLHENLPDTLKKQGVVRLKLRQVDGELQVILPLGVPTPSCVSAWAQPYAHDLTAKWTSLDVPLLK